MYQRRSVFAVALSAFLLVLLPACTATLHISDEENGSYVAHKRLEDCEGKVFQVRIRQLKDDHSVVDLTMQGTASNGKVMIDNDDLKQLDPAREMSIEITVVGGPDCEQFQDDQVYLAGPLLVDPLGPDDHGVDLDDFKLQTCVFLGVNYCEDTAAATNGALGGDCRVLSARTNYGDSTHAPLLFPPEFVSPSPSNAAPPDRRRTGPSVGPVPGTAPQDFTVAAAFEYHADLNNAHGCSSRQFFKDVAVVVHKAAGTVSLLFGKGVAPAVSWQADADNSYRGDTHTGLRQVRDGIIYEGAPEVIHWLDAPGNTKLEPNLAQAGFATVYTFVLRSVVWDADGDHGWECFSAAMAVVDKATAAPLAADDARMMLDALAPAPMPGQDAALIGDAVAALHRPRGEGGFTGEHNPEFRELVCHWF